MNINRFLRFLVRAIAPSSPQDGDIYKSADGIQVYSEDTQSWSQIWPAKVVSDAQQAVNMSDSVYTTICALSLSPGKYLLSGQLTFGGALNIGYVEATVTQETGTSYPLNGAIPGDNNMLTVPNGGSYGTIVTISSYYVEVPAGPSVAWYRRAYSSGGVNQAYGRLTAVQVG